MLLYKKKLNQRRMIKFTSHLNYCILQKQVKEQPTTTSNWPLCPQKARRVGSYRHKCTRGLILLCLWNIIWSLLTKSVHTILSWVWMDLDWSGWAIIMELHILFWEIYTFVYLPSKSKDLCHIKWSFLMGFFLSHILTSMIFFIVSQNYIKTVSALCLLFHLFRTPITILMNI